MPGPGAGQKRPPSMVNSIMLSGWHMSFPFQYVRCVMYPIVLRGRSVMLTKRSVAVWSVVGALGLILAMSAPGLAQEEWVTSGPYGGSVSVLLPSVSGAGGVYAGVQGYGVFFRTPYTRAWSPRSKGLEDLDITALAQHSEKPDVLYAGTSSGIYWTTDGGHEWEARNGEWSVWDVGAIAVAPSKPGVVYAGAVWAGYWRVCRSDDDGATWHATGEQIPTGLDITAIVVDPEDPEIVYVSTYDPHGYSPDDAGVYKTVTGGEKWFKSGDGLRNTDVLCLTMDPLSSSTLYAGVYSSQYRPYGGVYVSHDAGKSWKRISGDLPEGVELRINSIAVAHEPLGAHATLYAAGSYGYSLPQPGGTWTPRLYKSTDLGVTWVPQVNGSVFPDWLSVAVEPGNPFTVYAGSNCGGVFLSTNGGGNWVHWSTRLGLLGVTALTVDPKDAEMVYAGVVSYPGEYSRADAGVWVSFNGGATWSPRPQNMRIGDSFYVSSLAVSPGKPDTIFAANCGWLMYISRDTGQTWQSRGYAHGLTNYWLQTVKVDPLNPKIAYVTASGFTPCPPNIYKTYDLGESWTAIGSGLTRWEFLGFDISTDDPNTIYAGTAWETVLRSYDGGDHWMLTGDQLLDAKVGSVVVNPGAPKRVYAADCQTSDPMGVYASDNLGDKWYEINKGLDLLKIEALAIDSPWLAGEEYRTRLYCGTDGKGVYRRVEGGVWYDVNEGLGDRSVMCIAVAPGKTSTRTVHVGTKHGAYRRNIFDDDGLGDFGSGERP